MKKSKERRDIQRVADRIPTGSVLLDTCPKRVGEGFKRIKSRLSIEDQAKLAKITSKNLSDPSFTEEYYGKWNTNSNPRSS